MTKRPSIASLAPKKAAPSFTPEPAASEPSPSAPRNASKPSVPYKAVLAKVDEETHRALKILSANEGMPIGDLFVEALNLLFRSRSLPEIAVKVTPDERGKNR